MIRSFASALALTGCMWAQMSPSPAKLVASGGSAGASSISPNPVSIDNPGLRSLSDLPAQPKGKTTLLGGRIRAVDLVRDRLVLDIYGGGKMTVLFDERTRVFQEGKQASVDELKTGDRAYVDTTLDGKDVFARNIRVLTDSPAGQGNGQIVEFDASKRQLILRDTLSPRPVKMQLSPEAVIRRGEQPATQSDLRPGTLVTLVFASGSERQPQIREISILASPGASFGFSGRVSHLDLHTGLLVLVDPRDNRSYEVYVDPDNRALTRNVEEGVDVSVDATFDGRHYEARTITLNPSSAK